MSNCWRHDSISTCWFSPITWRCCLRHRRVTTNVDAIAPQDVRAPFRGLVSYAEDDAAVFFGRDTEMQLVIANLAAARFTVLYGSSGVGKSSLLRAGVKHRLDAMARENLRVSGTPQLGTVVFSSWSDDPLPLLCRRIRRSVAEAWVLPDARVDRQPPDARLDEEIARAAEAVDGELIVILDHFEDYFQYWGDDRTSKFVVELSKAVSSETVRASFLVSIRDDALSKLDCFEGQIPNLYSNLLRIDHLDREAARLAIEGPIAEYNRRASGTESASLATIEPALVERVLDDVRIGRLTLSDPHRVRTTGFPVEPSASEPERVETPYLQLVMQRLWEAELASANSAEVHLRLSTLERLGGAEQIVHTHLDTTLYELAPRDRDIAARIFSYLVTPSGTKIAYSTADLAAYARVTPGELTPVLGRLSTARILMPVAPNGDRHEARYEIVHDVLAAAILDWRSRYLRDKERDVAGRRLAVEQYRVSSLRRRVISLSGLLATVVALALIALVAPDAMGT